MPALVLESRTVTLVLKKDLSRAIKQGHAWLYSNAVDTPSIPTGSVVKLQDRKGQNIACGIYCPQHPISVRICKTQPPFELNEEWFVQRMEGALRLRGLWFGGKTTGFRLVNGEGDGLPGLIVDRYADTAVIKLDGGAPEKFYQTLPIAQWLAEKLGLESVVQRPRGRGTTGQTLVGHSGSQPVLFQENGMQFTADVMAGQKTGFFLDQRDNRAVIRSLSKDRQVLNLFSFSGGFSVAAGLGGALGVTSVDLSPQAIAACNVHWRLNGLPPENHRAVVADCFDWLQQAVRSEQRWSVVICDPPSFSPSQQTRQSALAAYARLAHGTSQLVEPGGLLALASCSSHIDSSNFSQANLEGIGKSRRMASLICQRCLPVDHPTPLAMPELRYLKFQLFQLA